MHSACGYRVVRAADVVHIDPPPPPIWSALASATGTTAPALPVIAGRFVAQPFLSSRDAFSTPKSLSHKV
jgi:hypothetical protein